jgi:hypothetical protein
MVVGFDPRQIVLMCSTNSLDTLAPSTNSAICLNVNLAYPVFTHLYDCFLMTFIDGWGCDVRSDPEEKKDQDGDKCGRLDYIIIFLFILCGAKPK